MRSRRRSQVPTRGKSHDPDAIRSNSVFSSTRPHHSNGTLRVAQFDGVMIAGAQSILQNEGGDSHRIKPVRHLAALVIGSEPYVASARTNYQSHTASLVFRRPE